MLHNNQLTRTIVPTFVRNLLKNQPWKNVQSLCTVATQQAIDETSNHKDCTKTGRFSK